MRVDIKPQWRNLANWYWDNAGGYDGVGMSIWDMLQRDYGAFKVFNINSVREDRKMWVQFPDEKTYTMFVLRWS